MARVHVQIIDYVRNSEKYSTLKTMKDTSSMLEPNRSHSRLRLKRDLRNSFRLCIHFKSHLNAEASRPTHIDTHARVAHVSRTHTAFIFSFHSCAPRRSNTVVDDASRWPKSVFDDHTVHTPLCGQTTFHMCPRACPACAFTI